MEAADLALVTFVMAVDRMRTLQQALGPVFTGTDLVILRNAEKEVDRLTAIYLFPAPVVATGKDGGR